MNSRNKPGYLSQSEYDFYKTLFEENKESKSNKISFQNFQDIVYANKNVNKQYIPEILSKIKSSYEKKAGLSSEDLLLSKNSFLFQ